MNGKLLTVFVIAVLAIGFTAPYMVSDDSDADSVIAVSDGLGNSYRLYSPASHVMTIGVGATATAIGVGALDKIVVCDSYSKTNTAAVFNDLKQYIKDGKILANGNLYSSGKDKLISDVTYAAGEDGKFNKEKDVVIVCGSNTYLKNIVPYLNENGFKYVMQWNDITEYDDVIEFVSTVSKVCTGILTDKVEQMKYVSSYIKDTVKDAGVAKTKAFYVTYSSSTYKVGNTGSLANSMIIAACGNSVTVDNSQSASTIAVGTAGLTNIINQNGKDTVIFIDNTIASDSAKVTAVRNAVGNDVKIVALESIWNNYSIESMDGLWTMASAMYPDLFEGDAPEVPGNKDNTKLFIIGGAVAAVVILVAAVIFLRK